MLNKLNETEFSMNISFFLLAGFDTIPLPKFEICDWWMIFLTLDVLELFFYSVDNLLSKDCKKTKFCQIN